MNKNQIEGSIKNIAGKVQQKVGAAIGNRTQQAKGVTKQIAGKVQKGAGDVQQAFHKIERKTR